MLDIGAYDGFFSFQAERRGAKRVVALEGMCRAAGFSRVETIIGSPLRPPSQ